MSARDRSAVHGRTLVASGDQAAAERTFGSGGVTLVGVDPSAVAGRFDRLGRGVEPDPRAPGS